MKIFDNFCPHDNLGVLFYIKGEEIHLIFHPYYSPDLALHDAWLNSYIKHHLLDQTDQKVFFNSASETLNSIPEKEYKKTFDKLLERMQRCIDNQGDYFEHLM
jgi:hypothetical protein